MSESFKLIQEIAQKRLEIQSLETRLRDIQAACQHLWRVTYNPIIQGGYQHPAEGAGSDYTPSFYVKRQEIRRWERFCPKCHLEQETQKTKTVRKESTERLVTLSDEPDFGD